MTSNLRLFQLRQGKNGPAIDSNPRYFSDKPSAKQARDALGGDTVVSYGPDHNRFIARKEK